MDLVPSPLLSNKKDKPVSAFPSFPFFNPNKLFGVER